MDSSDPLGNLSRGANGICRYFEGGISSVYFWDIDDGFAGCVLLKKCMHCSRQTTQKGG